MATIVERFETFKQEWKEADPKLKALMISICVLGIIVVTNQHFKNKEAEALAADKKAKAAVEASIAGNSGGMLQGTPTLPHHNRNLGLEDVMAEFANLKEKLARFEAANGHQKPVATDQPPSSNINLNEQLPPGRSAPIEGANPMNGGMGMQAPAGTGFSFSDDQPGFKPEPPKPAQPKMKVWPSEAKPQVKQESSGLGKMVLPKSTAIHAITLSGIYAFSASAVASAVGSVTSANNVGSPFVSKVKGSAELPNGWDIIELNNCAISGNATAKLGIERAYAIADTLSCVDEDGEIYEASIRAYALDTDGGLGLAGKVVSKQGEILQKAVITGSLAGLGQAFSPTAIPSYNTSAMSGQQQGMLLPNPEYVSRSMIGQGINNGVGQVSRFFLDFARELIPAIEVPSNTRVTWILQEPLEFKQPKSTRG